MLLDKLAAINRMLDAIGEAPVSSLTSGLSDAENAERLLEETSEEIQAKGWHTNTESELRLAPGLDGFITLSDNVLRVDTVGDSQDVNAVERDGRLYNVKDQTFTFTEAVLVDIVYRFAFEDLPYVLRNSIAWEAARRFQSVTLGDREKDKYLEKRANKAEADLTDSELESQDPNVLRDSESVRRIAWRNNRNALR